MRTCVLQLLLALALMAGSRAGPNAAAQEPAAQEPAAQEPAAQEPQGESLEAPLNPLRPSWYARAEGVALFRNVQEDTIVAYAGQLGTAGSSIALKRNDLDEQFTGGGRFTFGHTFGDSRYQIETNCLWQAPWVATASTSDLTSLLNSTPGTLFSPFTTFGNPPSTKVDYDNFVQIHEDSRFNSQEINLKGAIPSPDWMAMTILVGARHVGIREEFDYYAQPTTSLTDPTVFDPARTPNRIITQTRNDLWGPQIGVLMDLAASPNVWLELEVKGAVCDDGAARELDATIADTTYPHDHLWQAAAAYVGDANITAFWRPTDSLSVHIGYQLLAIEHLALACENFNESLPALTDQTAKPPLDRRGSVVYHGPHLGVELRW
jgi:hypothetical protein